jgi:hypothetical protein
MNSGIKLSGLAALVALTALFSACPQPPEEDEGEGFERDGIAKTVVINNIPSNLSRLILPRFPWTGPVR